jgi:uracil-DNA glycosylase
MEHHNLQHTDTRSHKERTLLGESWAKALPNIFEEAPMVDLRDFLQTQNKKGHIIYPHVNQVFRAFRLTPLDKVHIVLVGQDPYHGEGQAEGLCFSVPRGIALPPSLRNIFKELEDDLGVTAPKEGSLTHWAEQGCFLINTRLTVNAGQPLSHNHAGWDFFTEKVFETLNRKSHPVLFVLLGGHAQKIQKYITNPVNDILTAPHPSPLSSYRGFFGSKIFSKMNQFLEKNSYNPIKWTEDHH